MYIYISFLFWFLFLFFFWPPALGPLSAAPAPPGHPEVPSRHKGPRPPKQPYSGMEQQHFTLENMETSYVQN